MTATEREALVERLRSAAASWRLPDALDSREPEMEAALHDEAADMIEALSPAVTVTDEMLSRACEAYKGERHMVDRGAMMAALQAALTSPTPQTAGREE